MSTIVLAKLSERARVLLLLAAAALMLLCIEIAVVHSAAMQRNPGPLALGVTLDLTLVLPGLYYLLAVRKGQLPALSVFPVFAAALAGARLLLPATNQGLLRALTAVAVPCIELVSVGVLIFHLRAIRRRHESLSRTVIYPADAVAGSVREVLGDTLLVSWFLTETTLLYYALLGWSRAFRPGPGHQVFTYHRRNHYGALLCVLLVLVLIETAVVHVALTLWSPVAAWIVTALSLYGALWLLGDYHACRLHPMVLHGGVLHLRTGLRWQTTVPLGDLVEAVEPGADGGKPALNLAAMGGPSLILRLRRPVRVRGLFGTWREARELGVGVDDPAALRAALVVHPTAGR